MIETLLWWRFLWRQKRGKSAVAIHKGRVYFWSGVHKFPNPTTDVFVPPNKGDKIIHKIT